jgi:hypothetical protein
MASDSGVLAMMDLSLGIKHLLQSPLAELDVGGRCPLSLFGERMKHENSLW